MMFNLRSIVPLGVIPLLTLTACGGPTNLPPQDKPPAIERPANSSTQKTNDQNLASGKYSLQQATFDDGEGIYSLMLLDTPPGMPAVVRTQDLKMARLTEEEVKAGQKSYYQVESGSDTLHLAEDFRIDYTHNVTETRPDPQTGQPQTVVVRQESSFWSPFLGSVAGNVAGSAISSMLFRPQYYVPPMYSPGGMTGHGGYGQTYGQAVDNYRSRYNAPPVVERNRTTFRNSGSLTNRNRLPAGNGSAFEPSRRPAENADRPTGSGFGSSRLQPGKSRQPSTNRPARSSFGSSRRR